MIQEQLEESSVPSREGEFWFRHRHGRGVVEYRDFRKNSTKLTPGLWAVVAEFDGPVHAWRMGESHHCPARSECVIPITEKPSRTTESGVTPLSWRSSFSQEEYEAVVRKVQERIAKGELEQMNLCRVLSAKLPKYPDAAYLHVHLERGHPAPYSGYFNFSSEESGTIWLVSASPELAGQVQAGVLTMAPIKGTARTPEALLHKDYVENRLVAESLANELRAEFGGRLKLNLFEIEQYRSLVQLVSTLTLELPKAGEGGLDWPSLLKILVPPLSVTGVPREVASRAIEDLEVARRSFYCGAIGWIDTREDRAEFGVTIRSFWWENGALHYGTGAGITAASDPTGEWEETELKAKPLQELLSEAGVGTHG